MCDAGTLIALAGENGAGKSTLIKIAAGLLAPDRGSIEIDGEPVDLRTAADSIAAGIAVIHQELELAENLTVAENLFLGHQPTRGFLGLSDRPALYERSRKALDLVGLELDPGSPMESLSSGQKQLVEIARALSQNANVLILDEPTSSLSAGEAQILFLRLDELREAGLAIVYITHRLDEIERLADRVEVLRDGSNAGSLDRSQIEREAIIQLMVGRGLDTLYSHRPDSSRSAAECVLELTDVRPGGGVGEVSLTLHRGEILGLGGLVGAGRTAVLRTIFGIDQCAGGRIEVEGKRVALKTPRDAIAAGIALVPEDRKHEGLILELDTVDNLTIAHRDRLSPRGLRRRGEEQRVARAQRDRLGIRAASLDVPTSTLSGGNQQKVVLGKWLAAGGQILLLDEPTRGVDISARQEIYALLAQLVVEGVSVLMVSSDSEELLGLSDRILVFLNGAIAGELEGDARTEENVLRLALGGRAA